MKRVLVLLMICSIVSYGKVRIVRKEAYGKFGDSIGKKAERILVDDGNAKKFQMAFIRDGRLGIIWDTELAEILEGRHLEPVMRIIGDNGLAYDIEFGDCQILEYGRFYSFYAPHTSTKKILELFKKNKSVNIVAVCSVNRKASRVKVINMDLKGFTKGYNELLKSRKYNF